MIRPRTRKMLRDFWEARGRVGLMVTAIAVALVGVGALLVARAVITREAAAAYTSTNPAAATLDVDGGVDATLLAQVRTRPGVIDAAARQTIATRALVNGQWRRMLLFVVAPDDPMSVARFTVQSGTWPTSDDALLLERSSGTVLNAVPGGTVQIAGPNGPVTAITVAGLAYDPALAPAAQERTGYGYLTPSAAQRLGFSPMADELKIVTARDPSSVDSVASDVAAWLMTTGHTVHQVQAPPYQHPHQNQTNAITGLFLAFALAALLLAAVLVAATLGGMLSAQTRQIGIMKSVGATTGQLLRMYLSATVVIAAASTAVSIGPAVLAGYGLVGLVAGLLNIDITSLALPWWVFAVLVAAGIGIPVLVALGPILRAARVSVRTALDDHGLDAATGARRFDQWLARLRGSRTLMLTLRNLTRRLGRLALTVTLLAAGGGLFTASLNASSAWQVWVDNGLARRTYDAEIQLSAAAPAGAVLEAVRGTRGVTSAEMVTTLAATPADASGQIEVQRTYPDGGHGRFSLVGLPADTGTLHLEVLQGRWLLPGDSDGVVLNQGAATRLGTPRIGDTVHLAVAGRVGTWKVLGFVAEVGGPATAYTVPDALAPYVGVGRLTGIRVAVDKEDPGAAIARVEASVAGTGAIVASTTPTSELRTAIDQHVVIFIYTLTALAVLMGIVGLLGLASSMSITVVERRGEYGIMQAIGATPGTVRRLILAEGVLSGFLGAIAGVLIGLPLSIVVGDFLGRISFGLPLPFEVSVGGVLLWLGLVVAGAVAATLTAAYRAGRLTVRETLAYQ